MLVKTVLTDENILSYFIGSHKAAKKVPIHTPLTITKHATAHQNIYL